MSNALAIPEGFSPKSFWKKPEGKPGIALLIGAGVAAFFLLGKVIPFVLTTVQDTFYATLYLAALFGVLDVLFGLEPIGRTFRNVFKNIFQSVARGIAWTYTTIDPIGILRNDLDQMRQEKETLDQTVERFSGSYEGLKRNIDAKASEIANLRRKADKALQLAQQATNALEKERLTLERQTMLENAGFQMQNVKQLQALSGETEKLLTTFQHWSQTAEAKIQRASFRVDNLAQQRKLIVDAKKTLGVGKRLLGQRTEQEKQVDMAIEYLADDTARTLGEIREFSRYTDRLLTEDQIEAGAAADEAVAGLAEFNQKLLTAGGASTTIPTTIPAVTDIRVPVARMDDLFK